MTHHKDCLRTRADSNKCRCTCPVEPYTVEEIVAMDERIGPRFLVTLRAYAAQGKRIEELEAALGEAAMLARCMWRSVPLSETHRLSIASEALAYLRRHDLLTDEDRAFLAKQAKSK